MDKSISKYSCDKCGKEFKQKGHYTVHLNRKNPCVTETKLKKYNETNETNEINKPSNTNTPKKKFIDLFCGIGGFHQALKSLDMECVFACDIDKNCREVYKKNYGLEPASDITLVDEKTLPDFDIICAGFPCFVAGSKVLTVSGYKNIEDIKLKDKLITHTGLHQKILNLQQKIYNGNLYEIYSGYVSNTITCTEEHPFYIYNKKLKTITWKPICQINKFDYLSMVINTNAITPVFTFAFNPIKLDNIMHWFLLGYFLRYGWIEKKTDNICFLIPNKNHDLIFETINKVLPLSNKHCNLVSSKKYYGYDLNWFYILKQFEKENKKIIPEWLQDGPIDFIQEFLNGFNYNKIKLTTKNYYLSLGLQRLYLKLGIIYSIMKTKQYILSKKSNKSFIKDNYLWYQPELIYINRIDNKVVYNFEVETDNSYIVENAIVHNCQAFSNAGNKNMFNDKRGMLFEHILRIAVQKKPSFLFLENVKHIKKIGNGEVYKHIVKRIDESGYYVDEQKSIFELSPHQLGIPQHRERVIFVCIRKDIYKKEKEIVIIPPTISMNIEGIIETNQITTSKYTISKEIQNVLNAWDEMVKIFEIGQNMSPTILCNEFYTIYTNDEFLKLPAWKQEYITKNKDIYEKYKPQWDAWYTKHKDLINKKEIYGKLEWQTGKKKENDSVWNYFIQLRQSGIRVKKNDYFPTLVAIVQTPIYAKEKRYITPRECARLQGFPDTFIVHTTDNIAYKQFGNAVCVDVVKYVMEIVLKLYDFI
jgi:DNA (cytosine-5)-methyltransferase 1